MSETLPTGEQIRFRSSKTGEHNLDTYLEAAEIGDRQLFDMLNDIFDSGNNGLLRTELWTFQYNTTSKKLQVRVGDASTPFTDITSFFNVRGAFSTSTTYQNFDLVTVTNTDVYIVHGLSAGATFASEGNFTASANTFKLIDVANALSSATTQATNAASSASAASTSATNAATSATTATTKASEAATSATNAASSASGASTSASNASTSETNAASSASSASSSASNAASSASAANTSATNAAASATTAQNAAGTNADGSAAAPSISFSADTNTGLFRPGADQIGFTTGGTPRAVIDSSGNLLVGTTSATTDLGYAPKLKLSGSGPGLYFEETDTSQDYSITALGGKFYIRDATAVVPRLTIDSSGNVGIGTSSPDYELDISGTTDPRIILQSTGTASTDDTIFMNRIGGTSATNQIWFGDSGSAATGKLQYDHSNNAMSFHTNGGTERMRIDSSGNVGIGTTSPAQLVQISKATSAGTTSLLVSNSAGTGGSSAALKLGVSPEDNSVAKFAIIHERLAAYGGGDTYFCSNYAANTTEVTDADAVITIKGSTGNVGIGRTSPTYELDVDGAVGMYAATTETRNFEVGYGRTGNGYSYVDLIGDATYTDFGLRLIRGNTGPNTSSELAHRGTGPLVITALDAGYIDLRTANTNRIRITGTGLVGINTQTPTRHLSVNGSIQFASGGVIEAGTSSLNTYIAGVQGASGRWSFATNGSERMRITSSGNVGIGTSSPSYKLHVAGDIYATGNVTAYSSAAAKDNINTIPNALDLVEQLRGVTFDWKESGKKAVGLIYEEVKEVIPELTSDEGGHVGVAYQNTVALLIEAVKTLSAKVKELETK